MEQEQNEKFNVVDDKTAEWAMRKILEHEAERDRLVQVSKQQLEEYTKFYTKAIKDAQDECHFATEYLKGMLFEYFSTVPHKQNKAKTNEEYKLPSGKLVQHYDDLKLEANQDELLSWAKESAPEYVKTKTTESVAWSDLKDKLRIVDAETVINEETGETVPGVHVIEKPGEFEVKIKGINV